ncbi:glycerophosphodiester phosphodiesterase family protein [Herbiconiux sp. SYSU D00978]|uniref:glycerophosphodiester phosphodiesterase family protein n=1 Tax=Herbiconiux sp. SYSU D00978 TaxID=2812562 RepID=UPI001A96F86E|nr:glycerophosphodiester phosphodiesterase family protein [Herbiconiux sp. SYSU D00978]
MTRHPFLSGPLPRVLAHRGLATSAPENTLAAFQAAVDAGVTIVETDVHATKDGVVVVAHDPDLQRVAGRALTIEDLTLVELQAVDLGQGQTFPTLAEVLAAFPGIRFNIDVKSAAAARLVGDVVHRADAAERVLLTSFSERRRRRALRDAPGVATSASAPLFAVALFAVVLGLTPLARLALRRVQAVQIPPRAAGIDTAAPRVLRGLHRAGVEVHIWTVNDPRDMRRLLDAGVDGLVTDRADLALEVVRTG